MLQGTGLAALAALLPAELLGGCTNTPAAPKADKQTTTTTLPVTTTTCPPHGC